MNTQSYKEEIDGKKQIEDTYTALLIQDAIKNQNTRKLLKIIFGILPLDENTFKNNPYLDAYMQGRRSFMLDLRKLFTKEQLSLIENEDLDNDR